jgi:hypothetical protein
MCGNDTLNQCTEACIHMNHLIWDVKYGHPLKFGCRNHEMFGICYEWMYAVLLLESLVICGHQFCLEWYHPLFWRIWSEALKKESVWIQIIPPVATWFYVYKFFAHANECSLLLGTDNFCMFDIVFKPIQILHHVLFRVHSMGVLRCWKDA